MEMMNDDDDDGDEFQLLARPLGVFSCREDTQHRGKFFDAGPRALTRAVFWRERWELGSPKLDNISKETPLIYEYLKIEQTDLRIGYIVVQNTQFIM